MSEAVPPLLVLRMVEEQFHRDAEDDRPIREARTPPHLLRPGEIEYKACPYAGSRLGKPMNVSALRQTGARWDEVAGALGLLRAAYTAARGGAYGPELLDVWRVSQLGSALPWFFLLRDPAARAPAYAAALSKLTLGTGLLAQRLFVELLSTQQLPELSSAALLAAAERTDTLVGDTEVCAGSDKMILLFLELLVGPAPSAAPVGPVAALVPHEAAVLAFGAHYLAFKHLVWMYYLARRFLYADLARALGGHALASGARTRLEEPCEPPDFFVVGPEAMADTPLARRALWLRALALPLAPLDPGGADAALCARALKIAGAMGDLREAAAAGAGAEVAAVTGIAPDAAALAGRALAQLVRLDEIFGDVIADTESGFRTVYGHPPLEGRIPAALRDRVLPTSPRVYLQELAPAWLAATARP